MDDKQSTLRELALFAGAGGGILGGHLLGWKTVCAVEWEPYAACILAARQNDGILPPFPIWDDVQTFDGTKWRGLVDVVSGGFPCQDISQILASNCYIRPKGIEGERSKMWRHMARIIGEVRPKFAYIENSPALTIRGLDAVLSDLAQMGYDAEWGCVSANSCGANHERYRIWIVATDPDQAQLKRGRVSGRGRKAFSRGGLGSWWKDSSHVHRVDDGVAARVDRLAAIGNGQVPVVAATAFRILTGD